MGSLEARHSGCANIYRMMERLGVEVGGGIIPRYSLTYAAALHRCETCQCVAQCSKWLAADTASTLPPAFCPGADILFELAFDGQSDALGCALKSERAAKPSVREETGVSKN
jgi:hypothetical protein